MKIVHLVNDEKFIHFIADVFNSCEGTTNQFLVIVANPSTPLKYVTGLKNMRVIDKRYIQSGEIRKDLARCDALIVHYLDLLQMRAIHQSPKYLPIVWSGWGGDYYNLLPSVRNNLLGPDTARLQTLLTRKLATTQRVKAYFKSFVKSILYGHMVDKAIRRINYFSAPIPEDFDLLKKHISFAAKYTQINYASVERTFSLGPKNVNGRNILVGNSSSATNNHIDIFQMLSKINLMNRKVVVPLSYGDADYRDAILKYGQDILGENFYPVVDFVPVEQYNTMIAECSVVVMGHRRQQAVGNIATMLYKGAKVFLDEATTTYQFFQKRGAFIYGLSDLEEGGQSIFIPLSEEQKLKNREVIETYWGNKVVLSNVCHLVEALRTHREIGSA